MLAATRAQHPSDPQFTWAPLPAALLLVPEHPSERKTLENKFKALEKKGFGIIEAIKKDKGKLQDLCLLGTAVGASDLSSCVHSLQEISAEALQLAIRIDSSPEMILDYFTYAERIWLVIKAILELFCALLDKSISSAESTAAGQRNRTEVMFYCTIYFVVIEIL